MFHKSIIIYFVCVSLQLIIIDNKFTIIMKIEVQFNSFFSVPKIHVLESCRLFETVCVVLMSTHDIYTIIREISIHIISVISVNVARVNAVIPTSY